MKPKHELVDGMRDLREKVRKKIYPAGELDKKDLEIRLKNSGRLLDEMYSIAKALDGGYAFRTTEERIRFLWEHGLVVPKDLHEDLDENWKKKFDIILEKNLEATRKRFRFELARPYALSHQPELGKVLEEIKNLRTQYTELPEERDIPLNVQKVQDESQKHLDILHLVMQGKERLEQRLGERPIAAFDDAYVALKHLSGALELNLRYYRDVKRVIGKVNFAKRELEDFQKQINARERCNEHVKEIRMTMEKALDVNNQKNPITFLSKARKDLERAYTSLKAVYQDVLNTVNLKDTRARKKR